MINQNEHIEQVRVLSYYGTGIGEFEKQANELLDKGWELHGRLQITPTGANGSVIYTQVMVKRTNGDDGYAAYSGNEHALD